MKDYVTVIDERFQDPSGKWISLWMTYYNNRVIRAEWVIHLVNRVQVGEKNFGLPASIGRGT